MNLSIVLPPILLLLACGAYIFWPQRRLAAAPEKTRLDYLRERKEVIYENLRDLNFEYKAASIPKWTTRLSVIRWRVRRRAWCRRWNRWAVSAAISPEFRGYIIGEVS